jgi:hypothetical protein
MRGSNACGIWQGQDRGPLPVSCPPNQGINGAATQVIVCTCLAPLECVPDKWSEGPRGIVDAVEGAGRKSPQNALGGSSRPAKIRTRVGTNCSRRRCGALQAFGRCAVASRIVPGCAGTEWRSSVHFPRWCTLYENGRSDAYVRDGFARRSVCEGILGETDRQTGLWR